MSNYQDLVDYEPPKWATEMKNIPRKRYLLTHGPTPIHAWKYEPFEKCGFEVIIKRDDMTGCSLTGNKVRKLEFLLADAKEKKADLIMTAGGVQSNHCRATAIACRELGLDCRVFLMPTLDQRRHNLGLDLPNSTAEISGNYFLYHFAGAQCVFLPEGNYEKEITTVQDRMQQEMTESDRNSYCIPIGGSNSVGMWGYIDCVREMIAQGLEEKCDDIVFTTGSGGTAAGLALGLYLSGSKIRLHAYSVSAPANYFYDHIDQAIQECLPHRPLGKICARDLIHVIDNYRGRGYALPEKEELKFICNVAHQTGIMLDPIYTGRAAYGMYQEFQKQKQTGISTFKGTRVLFIHTGGIFGTFDGLMQRDLEEYVLKAI